MEMPPEPPAEGVLIEAARRDARLSVREAARRAGISEGWWRQVVRGYQSLSGGEHGIVRDVPAETVAKMARATDRITPERMETEGQRPDAAELMRRPARPEIPFDDGDPVGLHPWRQQVLREVYAAVGIASRLGPGELPDPSELPGAEATLAMLPPSRRPFRSVQVEADTWDDTELLLNERVSLIAMMRRLGAVADELEHRRPA